MSVAPEKIASRTGAKPSTVDPTAGSTVDPAVDLVDRCRAAGLLPGGGALPADPAAALERIEREATTDADAALILAVAVSAPVPPATGFVTTSPAAGGVLRPGPDGYRLSGRWPAVPGATVADRYAVAAELLHADGSRVGGPHRPELRTVLLPAGVPRVEPAPPDAGPPLAAARELVCADVPVPLDDVLDTFSAHPPAVSALGPPVPVAYRLALVAVAFGVARRAFVEFVTAARHRSRLGAVTRMAEQPLLQVELNRAVLDLRAARELVAAETRRLPAGGAASRADRVRVAAAALHAHRVAHDCVRFAFGRAGASALYSGHPLERCWRQSEELGRSALFDARAERAVSAAQLGWYVPGNLC